MDSHYLRKIRNYAKEIAFSFRFAADAPSRTLLAANTLQFHMANALGFRYPSNVAKRYRVRSRNNDRELFLRTFGGDIYLFYEVFLSTYYQIPDHLKREAMTIVDLGANIGLASRFFAETFPNARFVCVEPNPSNIAILRKNVATLGARVRIIEGAISDRAGEAHFAGSLECWRGRLDKNASSGCVVRCYTMDEIFTLGGIDRIDILKINIEGAEEQLFSQPASWIRKVRMILVELHGDYSIRRFEQDLKPYGFTVYPPNSKLGNQIVLALPTGDEPVLSNSLQVESLNP